MTWIIVGASSGVGRAIVERLARDGKPQILVSSDRRDLDPIASDIRIRFGTKVLVATADAAVPSDLVREIARAAEGEDVRGIIFPIGAVLDDDTGELSSQAMEDLLKINLVSVMAVCSHFLPGMVSRGRGTLVGIGSIAGIRGRGQNIAYSAAKCGLKTYFESLRHRYWKKGLVVQMYILGYHDTNLAYGRRLPLSAASPEHTAEKIVLRLDRESGVFYLPKIWFWVALALRHLPWSIFKRISA